MEFCAKFGPAVVVTSVLFVTFLYWPTFPKNSHSVPSRQLFSELQVKQKVIILFSPVLP